MCWTKGATYLVDHELPRVDLDSLVLLYSAFGERKPIRVSQQPLHKHRRLADDEVTHLGLCVLRVFENANVSATKTSRETVRMRQ